MLDDGRGRRRRGGAIRVAEDEERDVSDQPIPEPECLWRGGKLCFCLGLFCAIFGSVILLDETYRLEFCHLARFEADDETRLRTHVCEYLNVKNHTIETAYYVRKEMVDNVAPAVINFTRGVAIPAVEDAIHETIIAVQDAMHLGAELIDARTQAESRSGG